MYCEHKLSRRLLTIYQKEAYCHNNLGFLLNTHINIMKAGGLRNTMLTNEDMYPAYGAAL